MLINWPVFFKALSDETRLRILNLLTVQELCVCDLTEALATEQPKISRHLQVLRSAGVVSERKAAQWRYYSLAAAPWREQIESLFRQQIGKDPLYEADLEQLQTWLYRKKSENYCQ